MSRDWLESYRQTVKTNCNCGEELTEMSIKKLEPTTDLGIFFNCLSCKTTLFYPREKMEKMVAQ